MPEYIFDSTDDEGQWDSCLLLHSVQKKISWIQLSWSGIKQKMAADSLLNSAYINFITFLGLNNNKFIGFISNNASTPKFPAHP